MVTIIRNAKVYQPEYAGVKDILVLGDRIAALGENLKADFGGCVEGRGVGAGGRMRRAGRLSGDSSPAMSISSEEAERAASTHGHRRLLWEIWSETA